MEVKIIKGAATLKKEGSEITVIDFGTIKKDTRAEIQIFIDGVETSSLSSTCGCSTVANTEPNKYTILYKNTDIVEQFAKTIICNYKENGKLSSNYIKITGNVIK